MLAGMFGALLPAQCAPTVAPALDTPGVEWQLGVPVLIGGGAEWSTVWDPDGSGPLPECLVVSGWFQSIDGYPVSNVAYRDPSGAWHAIGSQLDQHQVLRIWTSPAGELLAVAQSPSYAWELRRWSSGVWGTVPLSGIPHWVAFLASGDLAVATSAGVEIHDGSSTTTLPPPPFSTVAKLVELPNGDLVAGDGASAQRAIWDGFNWTVYTSPVLTACRQLGLTSSGDLIDMGLDAVAIGPTVLVAGGLTTLSSFAELPNGELLITGLFSSLDGVPAQNVARWDGQNVSPVGLGLQTPNGMPRDIEVLPNGDFAAVGWLFGFNGYATQGVARFDGVSWGPFALSGFGGDIDAVLETSAGAVLVGGDFAAAPGSGASFVAELAGTRWNPLGSGVDGAVHAMVELPSGDVVVGGAFAQAGGAPIAHIARWDGTSWSPLGAGLNGAVRALATTAAGAVVASGTFTTAGGVAANGIARWDGSSWSALGAGLNGHAEALLVDGANVVAAGSFVSAGGIAANHIAQWNGSTWQPFGGGLDAAAHTLDRLTDGTIVVGGAFATAGGVATSGVARWDGQAWSGFGAGLPASPPVSSLRALPDGSVIAAHATAAPSQFELSRWDGATWSSYASWQGGRATLALPEPDRLLVAGGFDRLDGELVGQVAEMAFPCTATVTPYANLCPMANPPIWSTTGAWLGADLELQGSNFPASSIAVALIGFTTSLVDLSAVLQLPTPCRILTQPEVVLYQPTNGTVTFVVPVPNVPALQGSVLRTYGASLDYGGGPGQAAISNGFVLTIGSY